MIRNRFYYAVKPFVPLTLRRSIRRWFAVRKLSRVGHTWPIMPGTERPLANWRGWPNSKRFAFVITHDVEGQEGMDKCLELMEIELKFGFRSSFNFVPEGSYDVAPEILGILRQNGFEIGVHDLHHDGQLYSNRRSFAQKAIKINQYAKRWGAVGFRSGFMLRKLEWLHDLDIQYDSSTFDTDPFEPQPEGAGTMFPFWVPCNASRPKFGDESGTSSVGAKRKGYVELPYTLAQDSTLFLLLRERSIDIWRRKLAWIAAHGGMALVNVHPDYISFNGGGDSRLQFPVQLYEDLLQHVKLDYEGQYWDALPRDVALLQRNLQFGGSESKPAVDHY